MARIQLVPIVVLSLWSLSAALIGLASSAGRGLPNHKIMFTSRCGSHVEVVLLDWARALAVSFSKQPDRWEFVPAWSPGGEPIAFATVPAGSDAINTSGSAFTVPYHRNTDDALSWSPDGRHFAFIAHPYQAIPRIIIANAATGRIREFAVANYPTSFVWSPDGQQIAFEGGESAGYPASEIYTLDVATGAIRNISNDAGMDVSPAWSPDGRQLVFVSYRDGTSQLYVADLETGAVTKLAGDPTAEHSTPAWSPDGQQIAAVSDGYEIHIIDPAGGFAGISMPLIYGHIDSLAWSPDGSDLLITAQGAKSATQVYVVAVASGAATDVSLGLCGLDYTSWVPG